ncbi:sirohydrochlorin chelatase [Nonomuraea sp. NPDC050022]|uniref:sirohydrochlorin chelatase n=1 Tax=Nonomuraea sp. NPDC050022 TaxID=3364358 RepID=UPI0037B112B0
MPTLVLAAHGTRSAAGERSLAALAAAVRRARPRQRVELSYLEISSPLLADVLPTVPGPVVVVPLLLAGGYHVHIDLPNVVAEHRPDALVAPPLGPHRLLTAALARKLARAGLGPADTVILGAAGSSDPAGLADVRAAAHLLAVRLGRPVTAAFTSAGSPSLGEAVDRLRSGPLSGEAVDRLRSGPLSGEGADRLRSGPLSGEAVERLGSGPASRLAVASYLLAPGFFHDRLAEAGADLVSEPLGADPAVVELIWHRFDQTRTRTAVPNTWSAVQTA